MRVLVLTHRLPYPPDKGERIRAYHWLRALADGHDIDLLTLADKPPLPEHVNSLRAVVKHVHVIPRRPRTVAVRAIAAVGAGRSLTEAWFGSERFAGLLETQLAENDYDACLAICSSAGAYLLNHAKPRRLIVDFIDADSDKWRRYAESHAPPRRWLYRRESRKVAHIERRLLEHADVMTATSTAECRILNALAEQANVLAIPNGVACDRFKPVSTTSTFDKLVFLGQMDYFPNVDAVTWFAHNVWPNLTRRCPSLTWTIVGRRATRAVRQLGRLSGVTVTGEVDDVRSYLAGAVVIVPVRLACGVQNKILEAMAAGCPVVASRSAVRGLDVRPQDELLAADTPHEWFAAVRLLLADKTLATRFGRRARQAMQQRFDWRHIEADMRACLQGPQQTTDHTPDDAEALEPAWQNS